MVDQRSIPVPDGQIPASFTNCPGWWLCQHRGQSLMHSTFATRWLLQTGVEAHAPWAGWGCGAARLGRAVPPEVSLSLLGRSPYLWDEQGERACSVQRCLELSSVLTRLFAPAAVCPSPFLQSFLPNVHVPLNPLPISVYHQHIIEYISHFLPKPHSK